MVQSLQNKTDIGLSSKDVQEVDRKFNIMLAIVIPYFKRDYFEETLKSLVVQTNKNFKVYIGNDNSPEDPSKLVEKYTGFFSIQLTNFSENLGGISLVQQWERCISLVDGQEWILILGDDDRLGENVVEEFYRNQKDFIKLNVVRFASCKIDGKGKRISKIYERIKIESSVDFFFKTGRSSLSEYVFRKRVISEIGFKDLPLAWGADLLAVLEFSNFGDIYSINNAVVEVRYSDKNISGDPDNWRQKEKAIKMFYEYLIRNKKKHFNKTYWLVLLRRYEGILFQVRELNLQAWLKLLNFNLKDFEILNFLKFLRRSFLYLSKSQKQRKSE